MEDEIIYNKAESIKRCLESIRSNYNRSPATFLEDYIRQDAALLNLQRAAQAAIDVAAHIVRLKKLDLPKEAKDLFVALHKANILSEEIKKRMIGMVGFRNVAVHQYTELNMDTVVNIIESHLTDFEKFIREILKAK